MVVVGFAMAPELLVSTIAALESHPMTSETLSAQI